MMNEREKSDPATVAAKSANEAGQPGEEWMEPREMWTGKARSEHRIGQACHKRWAAYGKPQGKTRRRSLRRCFITWMCGCCGNRISH
jgi:hypothetical protein